MRTYDMYSDEDEFILEMPFIELVGEHEVSIEKIEVNFLRKEEIIGNFIELLECIQEDIQELSELADCYEYEDEDKYITYSIFPIPEEGKMELAFRYAVNHGPYEYPLYTAEYDFINATGRVLEEMGEGTHVFFHDELMELASNFDEILDYGTDSELEE